MQRSAEDIIAAWREPTTWTLREFRNHRLGGKDYDLVANKPLRDLEPAIMDMSFALEKATGTQRPSGYNETVIAYGENEHGQAVIMGEGAVRALVGAGLEVEGSEKLKNYTAEQSLMAQGARR